MLAIVIITYNQHRLLRTQLERIERHCIDEFKVIIIDNSSDKEEAKHIKYIASLGQHKYLKTNSSSQGGSSSHAFAANFSVQAIGKDYDYFLYLDHDCFPVKDFSVIKILSQQYVIAGIGQTRSKTYLWPGCLMFKQGLEIDFSVNHELGLDTGGNLYKIIEQAPDDVLYLNEAHTENPEFTKSMYNFYSLINDAMFMHFINGSGWNKVGHQDERIGSLLNVLSKL